jgi:CheY-like chemotaxis protein
MPRVLVIDDDEESRTLVKAMLMGVGLEVEEAADGDDGLRKFRASPAHLVITDINMPGMNGHQVIMAFRELNDAVPIIAISGGGSASKEDLLGDAMALGAVEVITKPFEFQQLVGAVKRAFVQWDD